MIEVILDSNVCKVKFETCWSWIYFQLKLSVRGEVSISNLSIFSIFSLRFQFSFSRRKWSARVATSSNFLRRSRLEIFEIQYYLFDIYWYLWYRTFITQAKDLTLLVEDGYWIVMHDFLVCKIGLFSEERIELKCKLLKICCFPVKCELAEIL